MPGDGTEEAGKRRTTSKLQSQNKDLPYRSKGEPKVAPRSSPYATRQLNGAEVEPEPERVQSELRGNIQQPVGEIAEERDRSEEEEELIKESECMEEDEMSSELVTFLKAMSERDWRRQEELDRERVEAAKREQAFRIKESECMEEDEMSSELVTFLKAMSERDQRRQEELDRERVEAAKREQAFRIEMAKEQEMLRSAEAEARSEKDGMTGCQGE